MKYSPQEVIQFVQEEDVKFIRLAFCDIYGRQKNISIMPSELSRAFEHGIAMDASATEGFGDEDNASAVINGPTNTATQGVAVPLAYGKIMVGSIIVASNLTAVDYSY